MDETRILIKLTANGGFEYPYFAVITIHGKEVVSGKVKEYKDVTDLLSRALSEEALHI